MTLPARTSPAPALHGVTGAPAAGMVAILGTCALLARPLAADLTDDPTVVLVVLFVGLGVVGAWWPIPRRDGDTGPAIGVPFAPAAALAIGVGAFAAGRLLGAGSLLAVAPPVVPVMLNGLAAVTEEAFFRRLVYGLLSPWGATVAVIGSAVAFAAVHVTVWGPAVLPLDLTAGLILSWQRAVSGRWTVPAVTHVAANVLGAG